MDQAACGTAVCLFTAPYIYVCEFKVVPQAGDGSAKRQLQEQRCADKYQRPDKAARLVGGSLHSTHKCNTSFLQYCKWKRPVLEQRGGNSHSLASNYVLRAGWCSAVAVALIQLLPRGGGERADVAHMRVVRPIASCARGD